MWDLPRPGLKPVSSPLAGEFLTTVPPGKPRNLVCWIYEFKVEVYLVGITGKWLLHTLKNYIFQEVLSVIGEDYILSFEYSELETLEGNTFITLLCDILHVFIANPSYWCCKLVLKVSLHCFKLMKHSSPRFLKIMWRKTQLSLILSQDELRQCFLYVMIENPIYRHVLLCLCENTS